MTTSIEQIDSALIYQLVKFNINQIQAQKEGKLSTVAINKLALNELTLCTDSYINQLIQRLKRLTEIQRRRFPNTEDLNLLLREGVVDLHGLTESFNQCCLFNKYQSNKSNIIEQRQKIEQKCQYLTIPDPESTSPLFNNQIGGNQQLEWIDQVTKRKLHRDYIPNWMPNLPPEHTWKSTPKFTERIRDPRILRERLVVEGRLGEKALEHIVVNEVREESIDSPIYEESISDSSSSVDEEEKIEKIQATDDNDKNPEFEADNNKQELGTEAFINEEEISGNEGENEDEVGDESPKRTKRESPKFDIVAFANKRLALLERRRRQEEKRINHRMNSEMAKWGQRLGAYTSLNNFPNEFTTELNQFKKRKYHELFHCLQIQEIKCNEWMRDKEEKKRLLEEERLKKVGANEIQVGMMNVESSIVNVNNQFEHNLEMVEVDEELEFDMDFSDMEDLEPVNKDPKDQVQSISTATSAPQISIQLPPASSSSSSSS